MVKDDLEKLKQGLSKDKRVGGVPLFWGSDEKLIVEVLPTGIPTFDAALDGGFAFGRISLLIGEFSSGKTLLAYMAIKQAQERGLTAAFIDVERSYDPSWARTLGVDVDNLLVSRPLTGEQAWNVAEALCKAQVGVLVMDSVAQLVATAEAEGAMEDMTMASLARLVNKGLRKVVAVNEKTAFILINQLRQKVGIVFGNPETLPGGKGQGFIAHQIVRVRRGDWIEEDKHRIGFQLKLKVEKSKMGAPWKEGSAPFYFTGIIDEIGGLVPLAVELGLIPKEGGWYTLPGGERVFGKQHLYEAVKADEAMQETLRELVKAVPDF
jgi:recombination protein RecA